MSFSCTITVPYDVGEMQKLFSTELKRQHPHSTVTLQRQGEKTVFTVQAEGVSALRAALNGLTSVLSVYEKTRQVTHG